VSTPQIQLEGVSVAFKPQPVSLAARLRRLLPGSGERIPRPGARGEVLALDRVSLRIEHGERVGLIGLNGAGKTTLLKTMAGIYPPTAGHVMHIGDVCPLFELATGFEMDQSGLDNIRIRGMLLGMTPAEIEHKLPDIVSFTELGDFLKLPVRTYSSGMFIRLAFGVSTAVDPEILLVDEVVGAGDIAFSAKAKLRLQQLMLRGKILVLSSHSLELISEFCDRVVWLDSGRVVMDGPSADVLAKYRSGGGKVSAEVFA